MKTIPPTEYSLLLRTDFSDEHAWESLCVALVAPVDVNGDGFRADFSPVSDRGFNGAAIEEFVSLASVAGHLFVCVADRVAVAARACYAFVVLKPPSDTTEEAWAIVEAGVRSMTPAQRVHRALTLTVTAHAFALAQIRRRYPDEDERRTRQRLAARMIEPAAMRAAFGSDD